MGLTLAAIGEHLDLTAKSVHEVLKNVSLSTDSPLDVIRIAYIRRLRKAASGHHPEDVQRRLAEAKAREAEVSADLKSMQLAEMTGQFVPADEVEAVLDEAFGAVRTELASMPDRIVDVLAVAGISVEADVFDGLVQDTLCHLAANQQDAAADGGPELEEVSAA